ncbi:calcium-dependent phosphotriesterase [Xylona heveae TC161]|uniref:Calcium-dependent phosphotriesterase n=1 Tax=Xylona heveae (strain CBS 132557 / TC161) TaxID=1328760 RepID=A0A164ZN97_XYLHT|nr:calcium-dependent phosphotriesterase [Xylona heveae TC161]KZF19306.1 calcium-dependent phosphotriesterase [Xylona heveae TC161]
MSIVQIDMLALAGNPNYFSTLTATNITQPAISLLSYNSAFEAQVIGQNATARNIADLPWQAFHEAGIYHKASNSLYVTSNFESIEDNINITVVSLEDYSITSTQFPDLWEANGGTSYYPPGSDMSQTPPQQIYCDQGDLNHYSSLVAVDPSTNISKVILTNFLGRNFSSLNDVRQHPYTGDLWITDPDYGHVQGLRPLPVLPGQVYRFEPGTGVIQVVADGFVKPNGLEFSPDYKTVYITDTGAVQYNLNLTGPSTIYAFDVTPDEKRLVNRRVFAFVDSGIPDGIHTDTDGNVWASCGDGVHIWNPEGILLGKIFVGETSNNFAFAPGKVFVFSNKRLWVVENIKAQGREVCKDFGVGCSSPRRH